MHSMLVTCNKDVTPSAALDAVCQLRSLETCFRRRWTRKRYGEVRFIVSNRYFYNLFRVHYEIVYITLSYLVKGGTVFLSPKWSFRD